VISRYLHDIQEMALEKKKDLFLENKMELRLITETF
jgi:hypothetical protein